MKGGVTNQTVKQHQHIKIHRFIRGNSRGPIKTPFLKEGKKEREGKRRRREGGREGRKEVSGISI